MREKIQRAIALTILCMVLFLPTLVACDLQPSGQESTSNEITVAPTDDLTEMPTSNITEEMTENSSEISSEEPTEEPTDAETGCSHDFGDWNVCREASCKEDGEKASICSICGETKNEVIPAKGHTEVVDTAVEATCTQTGLTEGKHCSVCGETITARTEIPAKGHTEVVDAAVEATCTQTGLTEGKHCGVCGETITAQTKTPAKGHTEVVDAAVEATCTQTGLTEGKHCGVCGETIAAQTKTPAKGHTEVVDAAVEATCTQFGWTESRYCTVCRITTVEAVMIPKRDHSVIIIEAKDATCTETGLTEERYCGECGKVFARAEEIPAKGHTYINGKCSVCANIPVPSNGLKYTSNGDGTCYVSGIGTCTDTEIIIPSLSPDGYTVTGIGEHAFVYEDSIISVLIPDSVKSIGYEAFYDCDSLTSVNIPRGVTYIGAGAFTDSGISELKVQEGNPVYHCVGNCLIETASKTLVFGYGFVDIPTDGSVTSIGYKALNGAVNYQITIPDSVTEIGLCAFSPKLEVLTLPKNIRGVDCGVFEKSSIGTVYYGGTVEEWPFYMDGVSSSYYFNSYIYCTNGEIIDVYNEHYCANCAAGECYFFGTWETFHHVKFYNGVTVIDIELWYVKSVSIPASVTRIADGVFESTEGGVSYVNYDGTLAQWRSVDIGQGNEGLKYITIHCKDGDIEPGLEYVSNGNGTCYVEGIGTCKDWYVMIPSTNSYGELVVGIGDYAFANLSTIGVVSIPDSVTYMGKGAFSRCPLLSSVEIPDGLTSIEDDTFAYCFYLNNVTIPDSVMRIGNGAFSECYHLAYVYYEGSMEKWNAIEMGENNFNSFYGTTTIYCSDGEITF